MEYIGENAFDGCYKLKYITLPSRLKTIGKGAFSLHKVIVPSDFVGNLEEVRCFCLYFYGTPESIEGIKRLDPNQAVFFYNDKQQDYNTWYFSDSGDITAKHGKNWELNNLPDFSKIRNK